MNARQRHFVQEYLIDPNATRAAIRAGYSKKTARSIGQENLTKPDIAAAIQQAQGERSERTQVTADMVVQELALHAFGRIGDFYNKDTGRLLGMTELSPGTQSRVASVVVLREKTHPTGGEVEKTTVTESVVKFKTYDKLRSLELLGRHLGMFKDKVEHSGEVSLLDALRRIEAKEDAAKCGVNTGR